VRGVTRLAARHAVRESILALCLAIAAEVNLHKHAGGYRLMPLVFSIFEQAGRLVGQDPLLRPTSTPVCPHPDIADCVCEERVLEDSRSYRLARGRAFQKRCA
jgi:hypothetical protein